MTEAIDLTEAERIIAYLIDEDRAKPYSSMEGAAADLLRKLIPEGADHRRLAGHLASLAGHSMDKALGLC